MNREIRQFREMGCNSRTGAAAIGDSRSKQRRRRSPVRDPVKPRPSRQGLDKTRTSRHAVATSPPPPPPLPPPPPPLPPPRTPSISWRAIFSEDYGQFYFFNPHTGETTWEPPPKSRMVQGAMAPPFVGNKSIGAGCETVAVRSKSLLDLSRGGKIQCRAGSLISLRGDGGKHPLVVQRREEIPEAADETGERGRTVRTRANNRTSVRSKDHVAVVRGVRHLSSKLADAEKGVPEQQNRARRKPLGKCGNDTEQALGTTRRGATQPEETRPLPGRCGEAEVLRREENGIKIPVKSRNSERSSRATRIATSLLQAENWLARNEPEVEVEHPRSHALTRSGRTQPRSKTTHGATRSPCTPVDERVQVGMPTCDEGSGATTSRLRGRAAAVWASIQLQRREEEEMTGKPEITRLGRSKQRSVDDLFLFQRNVEASRRQKRDEREAHENKSMTGRPETCGRSAVLVKQMRRDDASRTRLSTSKRLYGNAREQRRRQETLQMQVETAIRRRANPKISARSRSLPRGRNRGDASRRLYEQAVASRDEALQRERHLARNLPGGVTFHPEIHQRSTLLAQRRRERWVSAVGLGMAGSDGGSVAAADSAPATVQDFLLAEGELYNRRRRERRSRQEQLALRCKSPTVNRYSRLLLQKAERMSKSMRTLADSRVSEDFEDVDPGQKHEFSPHLEALDTSKRMLESRYGRGSIPSMEHRAKERELERLEREAQSAERDKENCDFVAKRIVRPSPEIGDTERFRGANIYERTKDYIRRKENRWASEREALLAEELADCTFAPELCTRSRGRSRNRQRTIDANGPASSTSGEVPAVDSENGMGQSMRTAERDGIAKRSAGSSGGCGGRSGKLRGSEGSSELPTGRRRRPEQQTATDDEGSWGGLSPFIGDDDEDDQEGGGAVGSRRGADCSVGPAGDVSNSDSEKASGRASEGRGGLSALKSRRQSGAARGADHGWMPDDGSVDDSTSNGSDHLLQVGDTTAAAPSVRTGNSGRRRGSGRAATRGTRGEASGADVAAASTLPRGWTAFTSPEGWAYFFNEERNVVQWKRPTR